MEHIKLNFYRFDEKITMADLRVGVGVDDEVSTGAKKVTSGLDDITKAIVKTVEANDSLAASSASTGNKLVDLANGALTRYRNAFSDMKKLMSSDIVSPKFKIQAETNINKAQLEDINSMRGSSMTSQNTNKILGMANTILKQNSSEYARQTKEIEKQINAEDALLAEERAKQTAIQQLSVAMQQVNEQKKGAFGTGTSGAIDTESAALTKMDVALEKIVGTGAKFNTTNTQMLAKFNALNAATTQTKSFWESYVTSMDRVTAKTEQMGNKFSTTIGKLKQAAITWRIMYGAFQQIWGILANTVDAAASYEEALNLYTVALGEYAEEGREWADRISTALYLDPKAIMQYTGALYNLVQGLGVGSKAAYVMGTNLTQLAFDMSSYLNIDFESAYTKLQSAMTGQSRAVASAGVAMQIASLQELAYSMGIKQNVADMTQAEKTYLRYIQIMRSTANMQGDLARTIITPENALRVVRQQFNQLARAIGSVFIPIIMKAIPYVMALTQILRELAASLGAKLGYKIQEIDYSSLKNVDTAVEDMNKKISTGVGKTTKGVNKGIKSVKDNVKGLKDTVNTTLASFDDLNVVSSKSKNDGTGGTGGVGGSGGIGGIGGGVGGGSILPDLEKYVKGYDMLNGLTDQFSKNIDKAKKNLKTFGTIAAVIGGILLGWKLLKHINNIAKFVQALKRGEGIGKILVPVFKNLRDKFHAINDATKALALGKGGFGDVVTACRNLLSPIGKVVATLGTSVLAFFAGKNAMQEWDGTAKDMTLNIGKAAVEIGLLTGAAALFVGSGGAMITATAGITGGLIGLGMALEDYMTKEERQKKYDTLFDGVGVSTKTLTDYLGGSVSHITKVTNEIINLGDKVDTADTKLREARDAFADLHIEMAAGAYTNKEKEIEKLAIATSNWKDAIKKNKDAQIEYHTKLLNDLLEEKVITKETYDERIKNMSDFYTRQALYQSEYATEFAKIEAQYAKDGDRKKYESDLQALNEKMLGIVDTSTNAAERLGQFNYMAVQDINLEEPENLLKTIKQLKASYEEGTESLKTQKKVEIERYEQEKRDLEALQAPLQARIDKGLTLDKTQQDTYNNNKKRLEDLSKTHEDTMNKIDTQAEGLGAQYKNFMDTIYVKISDAGMLGDKKVSESVKLILEEFKGLGNVDTSKAAFNLFDNYSKDLKSQGKTFSAQQISNFKQYGIKFSDSVLEGVTTQTTKNDLKWREAIGKPGIEGIQDAINYSKKNAPKLGEALGDGITTGIRNRSQDVKYAVGNKGLLGDATTAFKKDAQINSPSKVFMKLASYIPEGIAEGINKNDKVVTNAINNLVKSMQNKMKNVKLSMNFNTDMSGSFNKILSQLEKFISYWRNAINSALSETKSSLNSLDVNKKTGKVTYTKFAGISIPRIKTKAEGGYLSSGDLFFANENGMPEYITSLGGRSAVVNQEQMVQALTNAIVQGLSNMKTQNDGQPVVVYLGNDLIYKGMAKYRERENNRYGTTIA